MKSIPVSEILTLLKQHPQGLAAETIAQQLNGEFRNIRGRLGKLAMYGVIDREKKVNGVYRTRIVHEGSDNG